MLLSEDKGGKVEGFPYDKIALLLLFLMLSALFSLSETTFTIANKYRLRAAAEGGDRGAILALRLLDKIEHTLGALLVASNFFNVAISSLMTTIIATFFSQDGVIVTIGTIVTTILIVVFSEATPKIIGARFADILIRPLSYLTMYWVILLKPIVLLIDVFVTLLLKILHMRSHNSGNKADLQEFRVFIREFNGFSANDHRSMFLSLVDLDAVYVEDLMISRLSIEYINIKDDARMMRKRILTSRYNYLPVCSGDLSNVLGILEVRQVLHLLSTPDAISIENICAITTPAYFAVASTPVLQQMRFFQRDRASMGLVVDEYGDVIGLVTISNIVEEIIGEFSQQPISKNYVEEWKKGRSVILEGSIHIRIINKELNIKLPMDGSKTLNGLILSHLGDFPEGGVCVRIGDIILETVNIQERQIMTIRMYCLPIKLEKSK